MVFMSHMKKGFFLIFLLLLVSVTFMASYYAYMNFPVADTIVIIQDLQKGNKGTVKIPSAINLSFRLSLDGEIKDVNLSNFTIILTKHQSNEKYFLPGISYNSGPKTIYFGSQGKVLSSLKTGEQYMYIPPGEYDILLENKFIQHSFRMLTLNCNFTSTMRILSKDKN